MAYYWNIPLIPPYASFTQYTPVIPKLYWNVYSAEQRVKEICDWLSKLIQYCDFQATTVNAIKEALDDIQDGKLDEFIVSVIDEWFEENQPEIISDIEALQLAVQELNESLANYATKEELTALQNEIGEGFSSENTIEDNFTNVNEAIANVNEAIADETQARIDVDNAINKQLAYEYKSVNFKCVDRFIAGTFGSTGNSAAQAGCVFEQDEVKYWAQFIFDSNNTSNDRLVIRNLSNGATTCDVTMNLSHGYSVNYNEETKQLLTHDYENKQLVIIDVSNVYTPVIAQTINYIPTGIDNPITCWVDGNFGLLEWAAKRLTIIDNTLQTIETLILDFENTGNPQNINYDAASNNFYIGCSFPNCVIEVSRETATQTNVFKVEDYYGCIYMRELETGMRLNDTVYINNFENVDGLLVIALLETNLKTGTVTTDVLPYIQPTGNIGTNVDYENGTLIPTVDNTVFKLAGDAIKWAQSVGAYGMVFLNFANDYPLQIHASGAEIGIQSSNTDGITLHGIAVERGYLRLNPTNISIIPDVAYASSVHAAIYLLDSDGYIDGNNAPTLTNESSYTGACHFALASGKLNALRIVSPYTVNLVNSILFANREATVTKQTNYRSATIISN